MSEQESSVSEGSDPAPLLIADVPGIDPDEDRLDRRRFAAHLARTIQRVDATHGFVLGLHGSWGAGKTTFLNFVRHYLRYPADAHRELGLREQVPRDMQSPLLVDFNPWMFSGCADLLGQFFAHLAAAVKDSSVKRALEGLDTLLLDYGPVVAPALTSLAFGSDPRAAAIAVVGSGLLGRLAKGRSKRDATALRKQIEDKLAAAHVRILVVMDDVDRLRTDEIQHVFRLVRAVADFPGVVYLLAFDRESVAAALEKAYPGGGREYLDKIVQAPVDLPVADSFALMSMLVQGLNPLLETTPSGLADDQEFGNLYHDWLKLVIRTPRHVTRYVNALRASYPAVEGEVNASDFLAVESLRVFAPLAYDFLRANKDLFAGCPGRLESGFETRERLKRELDESLFTGDKPTVPPPIQRHLRALLSRLFPQFAWAYGGSEYDEHFLAGWQRQGRVCSPEVFDVYMAFGVPTGAVSRSDLDRVLSHAADQEAFTHEILTFASQSGRGGRSTRVLELLKRFNDEVLEGTIRADHALPIIAVLCDVGDRIIPREELHALSWAGVVQHIGWIVANLLEHVQQPEKRAAIASEAVSRGTSIFVPTRVVAWFEGQHGEEARAGAGHEPLVGVSDLPGLRAAAVRKIREAASDETLQSAPHLAYVLYRWREWTETPQEVDDYVVKLAGDEDGVIALARGFLSYMESWGMGIGGQVGDRVARRTPRVRPSNLASFGVDANRFAETARRILGAWKRDLSQPEVDALQAFIDEHEHPERYRD